MKIDFNKGYVLVSACDYRDRFLRVQCDTGFEPGTNPVNPNVVNLYDPTVAYVVGSQVILGGIVYACTTPIQGIPPPNILFWQVVSAYNWNTSYTVGQVVVFALVVYICIVDVPSGTANPNWDATGSSTDSPPGPSPIYLDPTYWQPIQPIATYNPATNYLVGNQVNFGNIAYQCILACVDIAPPAALNWAPAFVAMEQLPQAIYEAIMMYVPTILDASQANNRSQESESQAKKAGAQAGLLLKAYERVKGFSFRPIWDVGS